MKWYEIQGAVSVDLEHQTVDYEGRMHRGHEMWLATLKWVAEGR